MNVVLQLTGIEDELRRIVRDELSRANESASPWMNVKTAASYLDTSEDAIYGLVKREEIPVHRTPNGRLLFKREELDSWVRDAA